MARREEHMFFAGVLIAILGNYLISCLIEGIKALLEGAPPSHTSVWATSFMVTSVSVFYIAKDTMRYMYKPPKSKLRVFDYLTVSFVLLGIFMMVYSAIHG